MAHCSALSLEEFIAHAKHRGAGEELQQTREVLDFPFSQFQDVS